MIQWGTLVAVIIYFRHDIVRLSKAVFDDLFLQKFCRTPDSRLAWMIAAGTVPVVIIGLVLQKYIHEHLRSLYVIAAAAIVFALVLWAAEWISRRAHQAGKPGRELEQVTWWDAIIVGLWQALAIIPGASRSGVTITGGLFQGMTRETAARFSFLLSIPSVFGAGCYELYKKRDELLQSTDSITNLIVATVVSGFVGYASIAFLLEYLKKHTTYLFIIYRIILGVFLLALLLTHQINPFDDEEDAKPALAVPAKAVQD